MRRIHIHLRFESHITQRRLCGPGHHPGPGSPARSRCWLAIGRLDANGGQISGFCGHTFHLHIVYLRALLVRNRRLFFRICFVASCEMAVAGRTGPKSERGPHHAKGTRYVVKSLAALLRALAAILSSQDQHSSLHAFCLEIAPLSIELALHITARSNRQCMRAAARGRCR